MHNLPSTGTVVAFFTWKFLQERHFNLLAVSYRQVGYPHQKKKKINKETQALTDTLNRVELIDIYRAFHPKAADYTFFSSIHGTFSRIGHMLGHKVNLGKFKNIEIT